MKKPVMIILGVVLGVIVMAAAACAIVFSMLNNMKNADYYTLGNDQIPSIKLVIGPRDMSSFSLSTQNGVSLNSYTYQSDTSISDVETYLAYLVEEADFVPVQLNAGEQKLYYTKESLDSGKLLILDIENSGFTYVVTIQKGAGALPSSGG